MRQSQLQSHCDSEAGVLEIGGAVYVGPGRGKTAIWAAQLALMGLVGCVQCLPAGIPTRTLELEKWNQLEVSPFLTVGGLFVRGDVVKRGKNCRSDRVRCVGGVCMHAPPVPSYECMNCQLTTVTLRRKPNSLLQ